MKHIVVVEDDPVNAMLFRALLERRVGCRVTVTETPEEVLELARRGADAVVMDISLKGSSYEGRPVSGVDLCRRFKAESGADDYVAKPVVDHDAFVEKIRHWVREEAA
jgi:two-component system cell cycle response regulator DivK